jgi:hypothetical protein
MGRIADLDPFAGQVRLATGDDHFQISTRVGQRLQLGCQATGLVVEVAGPDIHLVEGVSHNQTSL